MKLPQASSLLPVGQRLYVRCLSQQPAQPPVDPAMVAKIKMFRQPTFRPWLPRILPSQNIEVAEKDELPNAEGIVAMIPKEQLKRKVRIFQPSRNTMQAGTARTQEWHVELDNQPRWANSLIGYASSADPLGASGLRRIRFRTLEQAMNFVKRQGWTYTVSKNMKAQDFEGKKSYAHNFLNYHVASRRARMEPAKFATSQYDQPGRGQSSWVNLKHSDYGGKESKLVSQTKWNDDQPFNHDASSWRYDNLVKAQELARKLGK